MFWKKLQRCRLLMLAILYTELGCLAFLSSLLKAIPCSQTYFTSGKWIKCISVSSKLFICLYLRLWFLPKLKLVQDTRGTISYPFVLLVTIEKSFFTIWNYYSSLARLKVIHDEVKNENRADLCFTPHCFTLIPVDVSSVRLARCGNPLQRKVRRFYLVKRTMNFTSQWTKRQKMYL